MRSDDMTARITEALEKGIRETVEAGDPGPFRRAALEAYRIRTKGRALAEDDAIVNHVFPSDVEQTVRLAVHIRDGDPEKAATLMKGALDSVLRRLSAVPGEHIVRREEQAGGKGGWWRRWRRG